MSLLKIWFSFVFIFFVSTSLVKSQNTINGTIKSDAKEFLQSVNVLIHPLNKTNQIIAFGFTNEKGVFSIDVSEKYDSIALSTKSLSFRDTIVFFKNRAQTLNIILPYQAKEIKEVKVKRSSINMRGDTVTYLVKTFAKGKDISIGDVISNMPGFEVTKEGQVYYQGKPIQKYYIEGMDLLEGNYTIANKNLPHTSVGAVEVMENHQPVKMLEGVLSSNETSINIKLRKDIAVTGNAQVGAGYGPFLHDINLTPMLFSPKQQAILTWQSNNVGKDLSNQFKPIQSGIVNIKGLSDVDNKLLGISSVTKPNIESNRYLLNSANLLNYSHLIKLNSSSELKINARFLSDYIDEEGYSLNTYYLPDSTFSYAERTASRFVKNDFGASLTYFQNVAKRYVKNTLSFEKYVDSEKGGINSTNFIALEAETPSFKASNELDFLLSEGKNFFGFYSMISIKSLPQYLVISPGVFNDLLNNGNNYSNTTQNINNNAFVTNNNLKFAHSFKRWVIRSEVGLKYEEQEYKSSMKIDGSLLAVDSLRNQINWVYFEQYVVESLNWEGNRFKINVDLPCSLFNYKIDSKYNNKPDDIQKFVVNPSVFLKWDINGYWSSKMSSGYSSSYDNPNSLTNGYIVTGYNSMQSKYWELDERQSVFGNLYLQYKNPLIGLFLSSNFMRRYVVRDFLFKQNMIDYGVFVREIVKEKNHNITDNLSANISWYFSNINSTFGLKTSISQSVGDYIFNNERQSSTIKVYSINPSFNISKWRSVGFDYNYNLSKTQQMSILKATVYEQKHKWSLYFYPNLVHYLGVDVDLYDVKQDNRDYPINLFANLVYSFKPVKNRLQVNARINNVFNKSLISRSYSSNNFLILNQYFVRSREFIVTLTIPLTNLRSK